MSLFSGIGKFFKKIFKAIVSAFKKFIDALGPFLPLLIIALVVFAPYLGPWLTEIGLGTVGGFITTIGTALAPLGIYGQLAVGLGTAFLIAPEGTSELITSVGEVVGDVVGAVGGGIVDGVGAALGGSSTLWIIGAVVLGYFVLTSDSSSSQSNKGSSNNARN